MIIKQQGSSMMEIDIKMGQMESITEIVTVRPEKSHPLCTSDGLNICDMSKAIIMNSRNEKISPLEYLDQKSVTNIGKLRMSCEESLWQEWVNAVERLCDCCQWGPISVMWVALNGKNHETFLQC